MFPAARFLQASFPLLWLTLYVYQNVLALVLQSVSFVARPINAHRHRAARQDL